MEPLLSSFLNTHLPLPCRTLHTPERLHSRPSHTQPSATPTLSGSKEGDSIIVSGMESVPVEAEKSVGDLPEGSVGSSLILDPDIEMAADHESLHSASSAQLSFEEGLNTLTSETPEWCGSWREGAELEGSHSQPIPGTGQERSLDGSKDGLQFGNHRRCDIQQVSQVPQSSSSKSLNSVTKSTWERRKAQFYHLLSKLQQQVWYVVYVVGVALTGITPEASAELMRRQAKVVPLTNALFSLGTEVSRLHCPELWVTGGDTQLAVSVMVGGGIERFLWKELHELVYSEENWARALYHLRHTLWPGGTLDKSRRRKRTDEEREERKQEAAKAFKKFLPSTLTSQVGKA